MSTNPLVWQQATVRIQQFYRLTKPRVVSLIVFTAVIGMFLSVPGAVPLDKLLLGTIGISLVAGAAAALNCLVEYKFDAIMARTKGRPLPQGKVSVPETLFFLVMVGGLGLFILHQWINPLTMWLTLGTFVGYAIIYTVILKPLTPQNIVIGGASGAMPPVLGWAAITGEISADALLLFLIIFAWTPPHFWALALYRKSDYAKIGMPMLPVTHGEEFTRLHVLLYTIILCIATVLPYLTQMSGLIYLVSVLILDAIFLYYAIRIYLHYTDQIAREAFRYSIIYLALLFTALLVDHYFYF
ncbi:MULTISPECIES: heme o synthase [Nitrosomonas]|uniref:Protoheme IX farnesyltransferase n=2 Tax=Nitrosomonas eutropha TaxID=916 RepID=COXX_NITEC|nr:MULTISPECIES: heme o synthase [Nitrosomonas]Q0ADH9.1 RecName: Full=Protoheme IX farnesyltransferase; AltName: Full=Heme B farnesyltransferase; AltName: Full=Heme O synthase [Nitrosomonas eutropha C91]ABI60603.1 protoheme IX farnesyltransferase [Nitrosomonas eutropha C91]MXS81194.1 protoheme IX farnesyltransferase [Nitrosomonas sp. GH22]PXV77519.1 protoheme IX farnesyltransferase [Nitrosomonas eutropha]SCX22132.1 protoheme IX farnesyltransferase [Nitrosomonas eutropha]SDW59825.1 protoheme I